MESLQWLERIADVELLARRGDQFRVTRRHLADQHRMCVEVVTLHNPDISAAISRRRKKSFTSASPGWQPVPPSACVEMAPQAAPYRMAASTDWPASQQWRKPALKESPAPVVSTGSTRGAGTRTRRPCNLSLIHISEPTRLGMI